MHGRPIPSRTPPPSPREDWGHEIEAGLARIASKARDERRELRLFRLGEAYLLATTTGRMVTVVIPTSRGNVEVLIPGAPRWRQ